jgi:hypothetical protein
VAEPLAARWEEAAKGPALVPEDAPSVPDLDDERAAPDPGELTTLEELLGARRRR